MQHLEVGSSSSNKLLAVEDFDRLSSLPPEIHRQILSYLPTIDAAKARFCCKIWRITWLSLPKLILDYNLFPEIERKVDTFVSFIDQTLANHDGLDVEVLELWLWPVIRCNFPIKTEWITFAIQHNVQKLVLYGKLDRGLSILNSVFSCHSLVKLELAIKNLVLTSLSGIPSLPNLRKLKLKHLVLSDFALAQDLFSCFPALEKLSIFFCDVLQLKVLSVSDCKLKEFIMCSCPGMEYCSVRIQTPPLTKFIYVSMESIEAELNIPEHMFGLIVDGEDAHVKSNNTYDMSRSVIKVTKELLKADKLMINHRVIKLISMAHDLPRQMSGAGHVFNNLMNLDLTLRPIVEHVRTVLLLVSRCTYLSKLYIEIADSIRETRDFLDVDDDLTDFVVKGGFRRLRCIKIENFGGDNTEMMLVRLLLAFAYQLDVMTIVASMRMVASGVYGKIVKILEFGKASEFARVKIERPA